ncbi:MAG: glycosyl hydrolase family 18 protein [Clostridium sp.]
MKLKKLVASITAGIMMLSLAPITSNAVTKEETTVNKQQIRNKTMIGYWHNFDNNSKKLKLREVNDNWDIINVSFGETNVSVDKSTIIFKPDPVITTEKEFIEDVKYLQSKGKKIVLSIGGMYGQVLLQTDKDRENFVNSLSGLIDKYGFDGFDLDLEHHMKQDDDFKNPKEPQNINLIKACHELHAKYGDDLLITMAPETDYVQGRLMSGSGGYLPLIYGIRDILDYISVQLYNSGPMNGSDGNPYGQATPDFVVAMTEMLLNGFEVGWGTKNYFPALREDQVVVGVPACSEAAPVGGYLAEAELNKALKALATGESYGGRYQMQNKNGYPNFRGVMSWSANWDAAKGFNFSNNVRKTLDSLPVVENKLQEASIKASDVKNGGFDLTITVPGRNTASSYELLENNKSIKTGTLVVGTSSSQSITVPFTNKGDGEYTYTVKVKDGSNTLPSQPCKVVISNGSGSGGETEDKPLGVKEAHPIGNKYLTVGFWQNFGDNGPNVKFQTLKEAHSGWDVYNVSFGEAPGDNCTVSFTPMYAEKEFIQDVKDLHAQGKRIVLSIGGQNGAISLTSKERKDKFVKSVCEVIDKYGFDGLDIDVETGITMDGQDNLDNPTSPSVVYMIEALTEITNKYGSNFILSMAPQNTDIQGGQGNNYGQNWGCYLPIINKLRDRVTYVTPQYYNNDSDIGLDGVKYPLGSTDNLVAESELLLQGFKVGYGDKEQFFKPLRPDQVLIGVPACTGAANNGIVKPSQVVDALKYLIEGKSFGGKYKMLKDKYPGFRGAMTWSTNWDASVGNPFVTTVSSYLNSLPLPENTLINALISNTEIKDQSYDIKVTIPGGNLANRYELFEGNKVISSGNLTVGDVTKEITKSFAKKPYGTYDYKVVLYSENGKSVTSTHSVTVQQQVVTPANPDVNGDGYVDILDLSTVATCYGSKYGESNYNAKCDMTGDGIVDIYDLVKVARNYKENPFPNDTWVKGKWYYKGDKVTYKGIEYICVKWDTNSEEPDSPYGPWQKVK